MQHPSMRSGRTQIISNERGHLKSDIPQSPASPWGSFMGTWQAERKPIQLKTRTKLMTHLAQVDLDQGEGGGSKRSSRVTSARVSRESQREGDTSPRPRSAQESQRAPCTTDSTNKPPTPASEADTQYRADTATSVHSSPAPHSKTASPVPSAREPSRLFSPSNSSHSRAASAASTRSGMSRTPLSSAPSRAQSATARTPHQTPLGSAGSSRFRITSVASSYLRDGETHTPLSATASLSSSRAQTAASSLQDQH